MSEPTIEEKLATAQKEIETLRSQLKTEQARTERFEQGFNAQQARATEESRKNRALKALLNEKGIPFDPKLVTGGSDAN